MMNVFARPTSDEWFFIGIISFLVFMLIIAAELVRRLMNGNSEYTRKFVHVVVGILMAFAPFVFTSGIPAILISIFAIVGTFVAGQTNVLQSLHATDRISYGTTLHPLAFLILVLTLWDRAPHILSLSILILAVPDVLAALTGKFVRTPHYFGFSSDKKTVEGSVVMFVSTTLLIMAYFAYGNYETPFPWIFIAIATAVVVSTWEMVCTHGLDNLTIPLSAAFMLHYFLISEPHHLPEQMMTALVFATVIAIVSHRFNFLSPSGSIAAFLLAVIVYGIGGWIWTFPLLIFFITSSLLSKFGIKRKKHLENVFDKTDKRDAGQVAANGGVAGMLMLLWYFFPDRTEFYYCFVASIAAVTADTWGTEIGTFVSGKPRSIISFKSVNIGTSGGVSIIGILGGALGAFLIVVSSTVFNQAQVPSSLIISVVVSGIFGSLIDSIFGATVQAQYVTVAGTMTEKIVLDGVSTTLHRGYSWITNDVVNLICGLSGAVLMYLLL